MLNICHSALNSAKNLAATCYLGLLPSKTLVSLEPEVERSGTPISKENLFSILIFLQSGVGFKQCNCVLA